jgi:hypothetical protein
MTSKQGRQESSFIYKNIAHLMPHGYHYAYSVDRLTKDAAACLRGRTTENRPGEKIRLPELLEHFHECSFILKKRVQGCREGRPRDL